MRQASCTLVLATASASCTLAASACPRMQTFLVEWVSAGSCMQQNMIPEIHENSSSGLDAMICVQADIHQFFCNFLNIPPRTSNRCNSWHRLATCNSSCAAEPWAVPHQLRIHIAYYNIHMRIHVHLSIYLSI